MFCRAKREMGAKGERIAEATWILDKTAATGDVIKAANPGKPTATNVLESEVKVVDGNEEDELLEQLMEEAVERGYE